MSDEWPHHKSDNLDVFVEQQAAEILRLRVENEKLRAALDDAAVELEFAHFASMNKRYKKAAKTARKAAALKETGNE